MDLPVASPWFEVRPEVGGVTRIGEPHVDLWLGANLWLVRGRDRDLVVDSGLGVASLRAELPRLFERDPVLVLTHTHPDHLGGAHEFDQVLVHPAEEALARSPEPGTLLGGRLLASLGIDPADVPPDEDPIPELLLDAAPHQGFDPVGFMVRPARPTGTVQDGDRIDLGDRVLTVLHLPGHSPGSVNLYDERSGELFSGDVVYEGGLVDYCARSDRVAYRATMQRLLELPVSQVHPGHGDDLDQDHLRRLAREYLRER
jgi:glyoxylase-like metal-dependent hydrolase (beta-lactamase superfamily II)